jgi:Mycobacterium membrane protein
MIRIHLIIISLITGIPVVAMAPAARADDSVTYEVTSSDIGAANIEYFDLSGRNRLQNVALPWRTNVTVANPYSNNAELRADWKPAAGRYKWVTARIYTHGSLICESRLDVGDAVCDGTGPYTGSGSMPVPPI